MTIRLSIHEARAGIVLDELKAHPAVTHLEDIAGLPRFREWRRDILDRAIGDLVVAGAIAVSDGSFSLADHEERAA